MESFILGYEIKITSCDWSRPSSGIKLKWNYFSNFQASDQKISFKRCFLFDSRVWKFLFKTANGIIQTGNGIISLTSRPLIKKLLFQHHSHMIQRVQNQFSKQEMELSKQKIELFPQFPSFWSKNFLFPNHEQTYQGWGQYAGS